MRVQRVVMASGAVSSTVLSDGSVIEPVEQFLAHLSAIERSPNTVKAYAHDLSDFFSYLQIRDLEWTAVRLEDLGRFVAWLRLPGEERHGRVVSLPWVEGALSASTVNRKLSALASFYEFHARHGVDVARLLTRWRPGRRGGSWKPFLAHLGARPERHQAVGLRRERRSPRELGAMEIKSLIEGCARLRDRFLLSLLAGTGLPRRRGTRPSPRGHRRPAL